MGYITNESVALITGGTRGIGLEAARGIGRLGATVVLIGQDSGRTERAVEQLVSEGIDAVGEVADVVDPQALSAAKDRLGPLGDPDVLVLSAGVMADRMTRTLRTSPEEWRRVMGVNLDGAFYSIATFAQGLARQRSGRVIGVSACLGRFTGPGTSGGLAPYRISKAGLNALLRNFAAEMQWGARGVLVDAMCPAHCRTDMGGPDAPRSATEGAATIVWLADRNGQTESGEPVATGLLWEDQEVIPW
jgi:NAD(P)-dependent dehydrogenase (short-subunit alcohol dehydrogenase family)